MKLISALAFASALILPAAAHAGFPVQMKEKCAVGGERFTYTTTGSYTIFGSRPDGKPYGSWRFPLALPVCPGNGLVMFKEFSKEELKQLPALLASPEFQALRTSETDYYRAAWLARALGSGDAAWLLLSASWENDDNAPRRARYQQEFITLARQVPAKPADLDWFALQVRAANALRELGRFDDADAALRVLPRDALTPKPAGTDWESKEAEASKIAWQAIIAELSAAIARKDASQEPLNMLPPEIAANLCLGDDEAAPRHDPLCLQEPLQSAVAKVKAQRAEYESAQ